MIKIERSLSISKIEKLYHTLLESHEEHLDLQLPKTIEQSDFSSFFAFIQFFATWVRNPKSGKLKLPLEPNSTSHQITEYLNDNELAYPCIALSWEKEIVDSQNNNIKLSLRDPSKNYFDKMDFLALKGLSVPLFCFDHDKSGRGLSKYFYTQTKQFVSEDNLGFNLFRAFQKIGTFNVQVFRNSIKDNLSAFDGIIHELFYNTHEHARTNEDGHNLYPNIRALYLKFHKKQPLKYIEQYRNSPSIVEYFQSDFQMNKSDELYFVEISVVDSGPGFAKRFLNVSEYNFSIEDEVEVIKKCLYRHNTSAKGLASETKGVGLDRVLQTLDRKGFIRIKSGRVDICRNMVSNNYEHPLNPEEIVVKDWKNNNADFIEHPAAQGSLISILYPLEY
jgi:hypothetical protein